MAEARLIWKKISECEQLARCSFGANLLFDRLIPHSDDDGRFYADPKKINKLIFTARDDISDDNIRGWLKELKKEKLIQLYFDHRVPFLRLRKFHDHQHLRKDIQPKVLFPGPPGKRPVTKRKRPVMKQAVTPRKVAVTGRNETERNVSGKEVKRKELEKEKELQREKGKKTIEKIPFSKFKREAINCLNDLADTNFSYNDTTTDRPLAAIYNLGYSMNEVRLVIANRVLKWKDDEEKRKDLDPRTLFEKDNFNNYLAEALKERKAGSK